MLTLLALLAAAPGLAIPEQACDDGRTFFPFWTGEYPMPVLKTKRPAPVLVAETPCGTPSRVCIMPRGLYHPWAEVNPPEVAFGTRAAPLRFIADGDFTADGLGPVKKGDELVVRTYIAEGLCNVSWRGKTEQTMCPGNDDAPWKEVPSSAPAEDQILRVACEGGAPGWLLVDPHLMVRPDFFEGKIKGYGEVSAN